MACIKANICHNLTTYKRIAVQGQNVVATGTGGAVCKGATPSVEQLGGRGFKPRLRSLLD
jgi:hypothetical protein